MTPHERFNEVHSLLLELEQMRRRQRAMEPRHSHPDHECQECEIMHQLSRLRNSTGEGRAP